MYNFLALLQGVWEGFSPSGKKPCHLWLGKELLPHIQLMILSVCQPDSGT
jgi:hypothetical protein